ncbi:MAG: hypothetical protein L6Q77_08540 [Bacteroidetes bacterium]|nr:hypothetical protein [Bacteroidota bacterium]
MSAGVLLLQFLVFLPDGGTLGSPGTLSLSAEVSGFSSETAWDYRGNSYSVPEVISRSLSAGGAWVLSETTRMSAGWTVWNSLGYGPEKTIGTGDGFFSVSFGIRPAINLMLAGSLVLRVPVGDTGRLDNPVPAGWGEIQKLALGSGTWHPAGLPEASILFEAGANFREDPKNHELLAGAGLGYDRAKWSVRLWNRWKWPLGLIRATDSPLTGSANGTGYGLVSLQIKAQVAEAWSLFGSADGLISRRNTAQGMTWRLGILRVVYGS